MEIKDEPLPLAAIPVGTQIMVLAIGGMCLWIVVAGVMAVCAHLWDAASYLVHLALR
jgi:hypothetical protein